MWLRVLAAVSLASAAVYEGTAKNGDFGFAFIGKFCFDKSKKNETGAGSVAGSVVVDLTVPNWDGMKPADKLKYTSGGYELWLFDDETDSWPSIYPYKKDSNCAEARSKIKNKNADNAIMSQYKVTFDENGHYTSGAGIIKQFLRPRFWFMALAHCEGDGAGKLLPVEYKTHFLNGQRGKWSIELGANEVGLNTLYLCVFLVYVPFMLIHFYGVVKLSKKLEYVHPMVKLFALVVLVQGGVVTLNMLHWGNYKNNGMGIPALLPIADSLDLVVRTLFVLILMLIAKGWTISGDELTGKKEVLGMVGSFFLAWALLILFKYAFEDPAATTPGLPLQIFNFLLLFVWLFFAIWFAFTIFKSYAKEDNPVKKTLFRNLGIVYFPWFFGLPFVSVLTLILSPWVAFKAYSTVAALFSLFGYMVLSFLLWPSRAEEYFNISTPDVMQAQIDTYEQL